MTQIHSKAQSLELAVKKPGVVRNIDIVVYASPKGSCPITQAGNAADDAFCFHRCDCNAYLSF